MSTTSSWVVITGCSSGIGLHVANGLRAQGYRVLPCCRTAAQRERLLESFENAVAFDLANEAQVERGASEILALTGGQIFALFNNAAYGQPGAVEDLSRAVLEQQFAGNFFGTHQLTRALLPALMAQRSARIIQHSSVLGFVGMGFRGAYNASKYALEGLTDTLRQELKGTSVKVSLIQPGPVLSEFRSNALKALRANIDCEHSRHAKSYQQSLQRLEAQGPAVPFTVGPEAVLKRVLHALQSRSPKVRYPVTAPTYVLGGLKRVLPNKWFDAVVKAASKA
ncbi:MAG TPA: SDR family NAD(P)-dependent oxidoreductase [Marinagarivorans sp.]